MAIKVRFYLRISDKKSPKDATIFCRLTNGRKTDLRIPTGFSIKSAYWNSKTGKPKNTTLYTDEEKERIDYISDYLNGIEKSLIIGLNNNPNYSKENAVIDIEVYKESKRSKPKEKVKEILPFLDILIAEMKSGELLYKSTPYSPNTIKVWNSFKLVLSNFLKSNRSITWDNIDKSMFDKYVKFLTNFGYTTKTANKYIICFKALLEHAYKRKQHKNKEIADDFHKIPEIEGCKTTNIYLTDKELQALYEMPLEKGSMKCKVRDIFLCGCYTAQRISDYGKFNEDNFITTVKGNSVVKLVQKKTSNSVTIPILNKNLLEIVKKYDYNIPYISDVIINREIKLICKELPKNVPSLLKKEKTILTMKEKDKETKGKIAYERDKNGSMIKYKYDLVCTHTARRSAITNLYLSGLFDTFQLMSISGHKTEKSFKEYICLSSEEIIDVYPLMTDCYQFIYVLREIFNKYRIDLKEEAQKMELDFGYFNRWEDLKSIGKENTRTYNQYEVTEAAQVLAMETLLSELNIKTNVNKSSFVDFFNFLTGRSLTTKRSGTNAYKYIGKAENKNYNKNCDVVAELFNRIGLFHLAEKVISGKNGQEKEN